MKTLQFQFTTTVSFSEPVTRHNFILRCLPRTNSRQTIHARLELTPYVPFDVQFDNWGNAMAVGLMAESHEHFEYTIAGTAVIDATRPDTTPPHPLYLRETPRTAMTPAMLSFLADSAADGMREMVLSGVGSASTPIFTTTHLMHTVHNLLTYSPGSTTVQTTAAEAFEARAGVCQDYTHVMISLVRSAGLPARYVSGLTVGEGATHAWVEVFIDGAWRGFDPTRDQLVDETYLKLAHGRDWSDCPIERGTFQGTAMQTQGVFMQVNEVDAQQ